MGPKSQKYFRFRYRVLLIAFLFIAPSQATYSGPQQDSKVRGLKACSEIVISWLMKGGRSTSQDETEVKKLLDCGMELFKLFRETGWKTILDMLPKEVKALIQNISKILDNPANNEGLLPLSLYFVYKSTELYARAESLELNLTAYKQEFKLLKDELNGIMQFAEMQIFKPLLRNGVTFKPDNFVRTIESLIDKLNHFSKRLIELNDRLYKDIEQGSGDRKWTMGYGVASSVECARSFLSGNPAVIFSSCGCGVYSVVTNYWSYNSLVETLEILKLLNTDIQKTREELEKFRAALEAKKWKIDLETGA